MNPILVWLLCSLSAIGGFILATLLVAASQTDQHPDPNTQGNSHINWRNQ